MNYSQIKENSLLIVAQGNLRQAQKKILALQLKGIRILTLRSYLLSFCAPYENYQLDYEIYHRFKTKLAEYTCFQKSLLSYSFIQECAAFLNKMHFYGISVHELDTSSSKNRELKAIMHEIYDLKSESSILLNTLKKLPNDLSAVYIDIQYPTLEEQKYIDILLSKKAHRLSSAPSTPVFEYHHANNPRCEIESIAQKIIQEQWKAENIMVACCDASSLELCHSVFSRYNIPHSVDLSKTSSLAFRCAALLKFSLRKDYASYIECLNQNCFGNLKELLEIQTYYPYFYDQSFPVFSIQDMKTSLFSNVEIARLQNKIQLAEKQKETLRPYLDKLLTENIFDILLCVDEILRLYSSESIHFLSEIHQIQHLFKECSVYLHEKEDLRLLIELLESLQTKTENKQFNTLQILPYSQVNEMEKITFVVQATQNHFSDFHALSGIFNEEYVSTLSKYPTLEKRYSHYHDTMIKKLKSGHFVYVSYPLSGYLGDSYESSLDIEQLLGKSVPYELLQFHTYEETIDPLDQATASSLYTKQHQLKGSVSSLEKYVGCPYAYFLKYGCRIKEPVESGFNVQKIGTLNHAILEEMVLKHQKDYAKSSLSEISNCIDLHLQDMKTIFPHLHLDLIRERLIENMQLNFMILADMEEHSSLTPSYCERKWEKDLLLEDGTLHLIGYIDRIDIAETTFRIIDYKSSAKKLEKDKVFSGQQLQLCTYLVQMNDELSLRPLGAFYYSFQNPRFALPYQKLLRRSKLIEEIDEAAKIKEIKKINRLQGWIFDENVEIMDDNASHVLGVSESKGRGIYARNVIKIDEIKDSLHEMMKIIATQILSGNVECSPNESACLFCKYASICRFKGTYTEKKPLVELPPCMRKEEKNNENVES